jgi:hypothetical protein
MTTLFDIGKRILAYMLCSHMWRHISGRIGRNATYQPLAGSTPCGWLFDKRLILRYNSKSAWQKDKWHTYCLLNTLPDFGIVVLY